MIRVVEIIGPFSDDPDGNKAKFEKANLELWEAGFYGYNPIANLSPMLGSLQERVFKERDIWIIERMDAVLVLPGWEHSEGVERELKEARRLGKPVFFSLQELKEQAKKF